MKPCLLLFLLLSPILLCQAENISVETFERRVFDLVNQQREAHQLPTLLPETALVDVARQHSKNMGLDDFFAHLDKQGLRVTDRMRKHHPEFLHCGVGENLHYMKIGSRQFDPEKIVGDWMTSEGHRANILEPQFTHMGVGVFLIGDKLYTTQVLATPILRLLGQLPEIFDAGKAYLVECEYLSPLPGPELKLSLAMPDPTIRVKVGEAVYYEGVIPLQLTWRDSGHFTLRLEFLACRGVFSLQAGWGEYYYDNLLKLTAD